MKCVFKGDDLGFFGFVFFILIFLCYFDGEFIGFGIGIGKEDCICEICVD